jgi:hypothetical protein
LQNTVKPGFASEDVDKFGNILWDEEMHYLDKMTNPDMWTHKKKEHMRARERHLKQKRFTLRHITGSRTITHHSSYHESRTTTATTTTSSNPSATTGSVFAPFNVSDLDTDVDLDVHFDGNGNDANCTLEHISSPPPSLGPAPVPIHPFFSLSMTSTTSNLQLQLLLSLHDSIFLLMRGASVVNTR